MVCQRSRLILQVSCQRRKRKRISSSDMGVIQISVISFKPGSEQRSCSCFLSASRMICASARRFCSKICTAEGRSAFDRSAMIKSAFAAGSSSGSSLSEKMWVKFTREGIFFMTSSVWLGCPVIYIWRRQVYIFPYLSPWKILVIITSLTSS